MAVAAAGEKMTELWHDLRPKLIDGTTISLPDTPKNQRAYPQSSRQKPGCGFPLMKLVGVFSLASGVLLDYAKGNKHHSGNAPGWFEEAPLALMEQIGPFRRSRLRIRSHF
jgi:hypothetical protein